METKLILILLIIILMVVFVLFFYVLLLNKNANSNKCDTDIQPTDPIIIRSNEGKKIKFGKENLLVKIENEDIDLFTIETGPNIESKKHVDYKFDQFFYILKGPYLLKTWDSNDETKTFKLQTGDLFFINKGTYYTITGSQSKGKVLGGFLPGNRIKLVEDIKKSFEENEGKNINQITAKYCFFQE